MSTEEGAGLGQGHGISRGCPGHPRASEAGGDAPRAAGQVREQGLRPDHPHGAQALLEEPVRSGARAVGAVRSASEGPFQPHKLDTAIPFMKTLIKPETAAPGFFHCYICLGFLSCLSPWAQMANAVLGWRQHCGRTGASLLGQGSCHWEVGAPGAGSWGPARRCFSRNQGANGDALSPQGGPVLVPMLLTPQASLGLSAGPPDPTAAEIIKASDGGMERVPYLGRPRWLLAPPPLTRSGRSL